MRKMPRLRLSCTCPKYQLGLFSPFIRSVVSNDSVVDSESLDQTVQMPEDAFWLGVAHMMLSKWQPVFLKKKAQRNILVIFCCCILPGKYEGTML